MRHYHPGGDTACALFWYYDFVPQRYLMPIAPIDKVWDSAISAHMNFGPRFVANITRFVEYSFAGKDPNHYPVLYCSCSTIYLRMPEQSASYSEALSRRLRMRINSADKSVTLTLSTEAQSRVKLTLPYRSQRRGGMGKGHFLPSWDDGHLRSSVKVISQVHGNSARTSSGHPI